MRVFLRVRGKRPNLFSAAINTPESEESSSLSGNGRILYFIRRTPPEGRNAKEKTELFRALQNEHGEWSKVEVIVPPINDEQELTPHILADNKTLFLLRNALSTAKKAKEQPSIAHALLWAKSGINRR